MTDGAEGRSPGAGDDPGDDLLERRYRWLLSVYPVAHRRAYEDEMIGVLMESARAGQRRPAPAETADLLLSGLAARLGRRSHPPVGAGWRDAAGAIGLLGVLIITADALSALAGSLLFVARTGGLRDPGIGQGLLFDVTLRSVAWLAVATAVLTGARRVAAPLGVGALVVDGALTTLQLSGSGWWLLREPLMPVLFLVTVTLLVLARRARPAATVLGRWGVGLLVAGVAVAATGASLRHWLADSYVPQFLSVPHTLVLVGLVLVPLGLWRARGASRRRIFVLVVPMVMLPVTKVLMAQAQRGGGASGHLSLSAVAPGVAAMIGLPLVAFALAAALLRVWERFVVSASTSPTTRQGAA